ncbi:hypothetical protein CB1_000047002 [Camelus ferus]|nr:hypothetical protein CB1_000047002 [Camelus ferus]
MPGPMRAVMSVLRSDRSAQVHRGDLGGEQHTSSQKLVTLPGPSSPLQPPGGQAQLVSLEVQLRGPQPHGPPLLSNPQPVVCDPSPSRYTLGGQQGGRPRAPHSTMLQTGQDEALEMLSLRVKGRRLTPYPTQPFPVGWQASSQEGGQVLRKRLREAVGLAKSFEIRSQQLSDSTSLVFEEGPQCHETGEKTQFYPWLKRTLQTSIH